MIIALSPEDLVYDFKGDMKSPKLKDFPALDCDILGPFDVVIYRYTDGEEDNVSILKKPDTERSLFATEIYGLNIQKLKKWQKSKVQGV